MSAVFFGKNKAASFSTNDFSWKLQNWGVMSNTWNLAWLLTHWEHFTSCNQYLLGTILTFDSLDLNILLDFGFESNSEWVFWGAVFDSSFFKLNNLFDQQSEREEN